MEPILLETFNLKRTPMGVSSKLEKLLELNETHGERWCVRGDSKPKPNDQIMRTERNK